MSTQYHITAENLHQNGYRALHAGDSYDHNFTVTRGGSALDLSGAKLWFTIKEDSTQEDADAKLQLTSDDTAEIEVTDAVAGEFTVKFRGTGLKSTEDLEGTWEYDLQAKLGDVAGTILTLAYGDIEFLKNITRATS
jgi:hypothetical protein